jgi:hypothetical protein
VSYILLSISILWRRRAHNFAYVMGGGDSHGTNDVVDVGAETLDDDPVAMYIGYYDIGVIDASDIYFVGLVNSHLL